jgi:hypothetical protein
MSQLSKPNQVGASTAILGENTVIGDAPVPLSGVPAVPAAASSNSSPAAPVALSSSQTTTTINAPASSVQVTVPNKSGPAVFSLVVTDNLGVKSAPAYATVNIQSPPVAVLTATPATVTAGGAITLSGAGSTSSGSIVSYTFSLVPAPG